MSKEAKSSKVESKPAISKGDKTHYNQQRVIDLFLSGKSISECAEDQKPMSRIYAHRILTTKVPKEYAAEQAKRSAAREAAKKGA